MQVWWLPFLALFSSRPQLPGDVQNNVSAASEDDYLNSQYFSSRPQLPVYFQDNVYAFCDNETVLFQRNLLFDDEHLFFPIFSCTHATGEPTAR